MSLLFDSEFYGECVYLDKVRQPDGEGGAITVWREGATFMASVTLDNSVTARAADAQDAIGIYTVTTDKRTTLEFHDVFKRKRDGKIFRVTTDGDDKATPAAASLNMRQVNAQEWELPL